MAYSGNTNGENYDSLLGLAGDLAGRDTINEVLAAVVVADKAYRLRNNSNSQEIANSAGRRVGALFEREADRVLVRKKGVSEPVYKAFVSEAYREPNPAKLRYTRENDRALILYSGVGGYTGCSMAFGHFLGELGFKAENITMLHHLEFFDSKKAAKAFRESGTRFLKGFTAKNGPYTISLDAADPFCNIIVYFSGVANRGGFFFTPEEANSVDYESWAEQFKDHKGNIVFVNDTAFAGSLSEPLEKLGMLHERAMLLAGSADEESHSNLFSRELMEAYLEGSVYTPKTIDVTSTQMALPDILASMFGVEKPSVKIQKRIQKPGKSGANLDYLLVNYK